MTWIVATIWYTLRPTETTMGKAEDDYFDQKHAAPLKAALLHINAVQAEFARARQKFQVNPPNLPTAKMAEFAAFKQVCARHFGQADLHLAKAIAAGGRISVKYKTRGI